MKKSRLEEIITLVEQNDIETQEEITSLLKEAGYSVTQATVSRDIKKLGLIKMPGKTGRQIYTLPKGTKVDLSEKYIRIGFGNGRIFVKFRFGSFLFRFFLCASFNFFSAF